MALLGERLKQKGRRLSRLVAGADESHIGGAPQDGRIPGSWAAGAGQPVSPERQGAAGAGRVQRLARALTPSPMSPPVPPTIPGELIPEPGELELNAGRPVTTLAVANTGDRPVQVGSHFHFFEVNSALRFDRDAARGLRLDIPAGTAIRFEPGDQRDVQLVPFAGERRVFGFNGLVNGPLD